VVREGLADQFPHRILGAAVGGGHRVESVALLVVDRERGPEERQDCLAGGGGQLLDKGRKIDRRHVRLEMRDWVKGRRCSGQRAVFAEFGAASREPAMRFLHGKTGCLPCFCCAAIYIVAMR
jgi:hypothetical protein